MGACRLLQRDPPQNPLRRLFPVRTVLTTFPRGLWGILKNMERRRALFLAQRRLWQLAYIVFGVSLLLPTLPLNSSTIMGFVCVVLAPAYYASNAMLVLSPLLMLLMNNSRPKVQAVLAFMSVVSTMFVLMLPVYYGLPRYPELPGYYAWAAAHFILTIAFCIPASNPGRRSRGRAFEVVLVNKEIHCRHCGCELRTMSGRCPACAMLTTVLAPGAKPYRLPPRPAGTHATRPVRDVRESDRASTDCT
jgi:hypothetical protein